MMLFLMIFFWMHVAIVRSEGKRIPTKIRRKMNAQEWADLKRKFEIIAAQARHAISYINEMDRRG